MFPNIHVVAGVPFSLHDSILGLGMLVAGIAWWRESVRLRLSDDDRIWWVALGALTGAALGARLGTWPQHLDPRENLSLLDQWVSGNRSIIAGLVGAYLGVIVAKRISGYRRSTGDAFAPAVALGMAIGRVGCLLTEVPGTPTGASWGVTLSPDAAAWLPGAPIGIPLHPSFAYEIAFHAVAFAVLWSMRGRSLPPGTLFRGYVIAYAAFRFLVEYVRGNEDVWLELTRAQWFLLAAATLATLWKLARRALRARTSRPSARAGATLAS